MKEIIYIQAGNISNHVGTHFWNAQQSYFTYREGEEVLVEHDVSFREGISPRVSRSLDVPLWVSGSDVATGRTNILPATTPI
jgi:hypothetical protein